MKWRRSIFSVTMLLCALHMTAGDSIGVQQSDYELRIQRMQKTWMTLIPTHFLVQNAGNMGVLSAGVGWSYGRHRRLETELLWGFIPKHEATRAKLTMTLKENYTPWNIDLSLASSQMPTNRWYWAPLTTSLYINTVYGHEFWKKQPVRYPDKYYEFMSTKFRLNVALGQRVTFQIPENKRKRHSHISFLYEVSTCDLYIRSLFQGNGIKIHDILGLSLAIKYYTL